MMTQVPVQLRWYRLYSTSLGYVLYSQKMTEQQRNEANQQLRAEGSQARWIS